MVDLILIINGYIGDTCLIVNEGTLNNMYSDRYGPLGTKDTSSTKNTTAKTGAYVIECTVQGVLPSGGLRGPFCAT